jgi:hypothetical protein
MLRYSFHSIHVTALSLATEGSLLRRTEVCPKLTDIELTVTLSLAVSSLRDHSSALGGSSGREVISLIKLGAFGA